MAVFTIEPFAGLKQARVEWRQLSNHTKGRAMKKLSPKQKRFVDEYLIDLNASAAARRAGYSPRWINANVQQTLQNTAVQAALKARMDERAKRTEIDQDYVLIGIKAVFEDATQICDGAMLDRTNALQALEKMAKHVGLYGKDNAQRGKVDQEARQAFMTDLFAAIGAATGRGLPKPREDRDE